MAPRKKAKAPAPKAGGYDAAAERIRQAQALFKVHPQGTDLTFTLPLNNLPMWVRRMVRAETGESIETLSMNGVGVQTFAIFWWVSRLCDGEQMHVGGRSIPLPLELVESEWEERCGGVLLGRIDTEWINAHDGSDPEADPSGETPGQPD